MDHREIVGNGGLDSSNSDWQTFEDVEMIVQVLLLLTITCLRKTLYHELS
jgi:hypothetical protein